MSRYDFLNLNLPKEVISTGRALEKQGGVLFDIPMIVPQNSYLQYILQDEIDIYSRKYYVLTEKSWILMDKSMFSYGKFFWGYSRFYNDSNIVIWIIAIKSQIDEIIECLQIGKIEYLLYEKDELVSIRAWLG